MIRVALLSTAAINDALLEGARRSDLVEVIGAGSRDRARAEAYARERGLERAYGRYEEVLADPDVDLVYVALPNAFHVEWALEALEAGKHVLSEKPLSRDPAEVERAFDAAERAGRLLMEGFMYRHHPQTKRLKQLVDDGAIGELRLVRTHFSFTLDRPADVRWDRELGGGSLLDLGCYCVNLSRLLAGEPEVVYAEQTLARGVDVRFAATMRFGGGVLAHFDCAFDLPRRVEAEAVGSEGSLFLRRPFIDDHVVLELRRNDSDVEQTWTEDANRYELELDNVARAIAREEPPLLDRRESVAQARVIAALIRSAESTSPTILVGPGTSGHEGGP